MIRKILFISSILFSLCVLSQETKESTLDIIAKKTCEYLDSEELVVLDIQQKTIKLGAFIITLYGEYEEQLKEEGYSMDFSSDSAGEEFGEKVGIHMVKFCSNSLVAFAGESEVLEDENVGYFLGKIEAIVGEDISFIEVRNNEGILQKFVWLGNFIGSDVIISSEMNDIKNMNVKIAYKNTECFSRKLNEYIIRKEIIKIEYLD